jgi:hypothetical protein
MENLDVLKSDSRVLDIYRERLYLKKENGNWVGKCPFHSEKSGSFVVNNKQGNWLHKCFGCNESGSIVDFVQKMDSISTGEAIKKIREKLGSIKLVEQTFKPLGEETKAVVLPIFKIEPLEKNLPGSAGEEWLLKERGVTLEAAKKLHIGFRGDQLAFPLITNGMVTGIKYRSIKSKEFVYQKGMVNGLFNSDSVDVFKPVFLTEGELDACVFSQSGFSAVALPGATYKLKPDEKKILKSSDEIFLAGDSDTQGRECMSRLWTELGDKTYLIEWPIGIKDANEFLIKKCAKNPEIFKTELLKLTAAARSTPMPHIQSLRESLENSQRLKLSDHPDRLKFPWPRVDKMANLLPGSVMVISTTNTKMGKTCWVKDVSIYNAFKGEVVLNYGVELSIDEFSNMVAAGLLKKERNHLSEADNKAAAKLLGNVRYYYGRNPTLTTVGPVLDLIEEAIKRLGITLVVLDHIHFLCRNTNTEIQDQSNAMQRLKNLAVKYGLKVIIVAQPRKAKQENKGKAIHITDFKGSESLGSDADAVFALHREFVKIKDPMNPPMDAYESKTEVSLVGVRSKGDGPAYCELLFLGEFASFVELTDQNPVDGEPEMW